MPNSLGLTPPATPFGITIPHINNYPEGSSASRSSIKDCHHNVLCHPHRGHQSKIVITTCCVIRIAVINQRLSSQRVVSSASRSSIEDCHHNVLCHPHRGHRLKIVIKRSLSSHVMCHRLRRHPLRGHHLRCHRNLLCKEKVPDRCRGLSPKP
jgi:hypothetical protein